MAANIPDETVIETRLWKEIDKVRVGMLGVVSGEPRHFQPMTAFVDPAARQLWFFTYKDTDLADSLRMSGGRAMFVFQKKDLHACVGGRLALRHDSGRMDAFWNPTVSAWYPQGKDDPRLTLLRLACEDAQVWTSETGPARFAWEIARANATGQQPDLGERINLNFH